MFLDHCMKLGKLIFDYDLSDTTMIIIRYDYLLILLSHYYYRYRYDYTKEHESDECSVW